MAEQTLEDRFSKFGTPALRSIEERFPRFTSAEWLPDTVPTAKRTPVIRDLLSKLPDWVDAEYTPGDKRPVGSRNEARPSVSDPGFITVKDPLIAKQNNLARGIEDYDAVRAVAHESAHSIWHNEMTGEQQSAWDKLHAKYTQKAADPAKRPEAFNEYSDVPFHSFAEAFGDFVSDPENLQKKGPDVYKFFSKMLGFEYSRKRGAASLDDRFSKFNTAPPETTALTAPEEVRFQKWISANQITDLDHPDSHYDYRGYWKEFGDKSVRFGTDHFPDTYKQHGHPTFSVESKYSKGPNDGGRWEGDIYIPPSESALGDRFSKFKPLISPEHEQQIFNRRFEQASKPRIKPAEPSFTKALAIPEGHAEALQTPISKEIVGTTASDLAERWLPYKADEGRTYGAARRAAKMVGGVADWMQSPEGLAVAAAEALTAGAATPVVSTLLGVQFGVEGTQEAIKGLDDIRDNGMNRENVEQFLTGLTMAEGGLTLRAATKKVAAKQQPTWFDSFVEEARKHSEEATKPEAPKPSTKPVAPPVTEPLPETAPTVEVTPETIVAKPEPEISEAAPESAPKRESTLTTLKEDYDALVSHPARGSVVNVLSAEDKAQQSVTSRLETAAEESPDPVVADYLDKLEEAAKLHHPDALPAVDAAYEALREGDRKKFARMAEVARQQMSSEYQKRSAEEAYRRATGEEPPKSEMRTSVEIAAERDEAAKKLEGAQLSFDLVAGKAKSANPVARDVYREALENLNKAKAEVGRLHGEFLEARSAEKGAATPPSTPEQTPRLKRTPAEHKIIQEGAAVEMQKWAESVRDLQDQLKSGDSAMTMESNAEGKALEEAQTKKAASIKSLGAKEFSPLAKFKESPGELAHIIEAAADPKKADLTPKQRRIFKEIYEAFDQAYEDAHHENIREYLTRADEQNTRDLLGPDAESLLKGDEDISFDFGESTIEKIDAFEERQKAALKDLIKGAATGKTAGMALPVEVLGRLAAIGAAKLLKGTIGFYKWAKEMREEFGDLIKSSTDLQDIWDAAMKRVEPLKGTTAAERKRLEGPLMDQLMETGELPPAGKLVIALQRASTARKALEAAYTEERSKRFKAVSAEMAASTGEASHYQTLSKMKGEMAPELKQFTPLELAQADRDGLFKQVHTFNEFMPGERLAAADGLRQILDGRVPQASQILLLARIFGKQFAMDLLAKAPRPIWDTIIQLRNVGLLTGVKTHIRNIGGNAGFQALEEIARIPTATVDMVLAVGTKRRTVQGASPKALAAALKEARTKGLAAAKQIMKEGASPDELGKMDMHAEMNTGIRWIDAYANFVIRTMAAEDRVSKSFAYRRSLMEQAVLESRNTGRSVAEILASGDEGLIQRAIADAEFATFNNPNVVAEGIKGFQSKVRAKGTAGKVVAGGVDIFVPFKNTPANIIARVFDYAGGGFVKAGHAGYRSLVERSMSPELQSTISRGIGRGMTGAAIITIGYMLGKRGLATGITPTEPGQQNVATAAGRLPGAIQAFGRWQQVSQFSPAGNLIAIGATIQRESTKPLRSEAVRPGNIAGIATRTALEQPMLKGTSDIIEALRNPASSGEKMTSSTIGSFVPTILADAAAVFDPYMRDARSDSFAESLYKGFQARLPGLRNLLPPRTDVLGQPVEEPPLVPINPLISTKAKELSTPGMQRLITSQTSIGMPRREPGEAKEVYALRTQIVGAEISRRLNAVRFGPSDTMDIQRRKVSQAIDSARQSKESMFAAVKRMPENQREAFLKSQIAKVK